MCYLFFSPAFFSTPSPVIPKLNCVFAVEVDGFLSYINGRKFQLRSSEWSAKKFKAKGTIDL